MRSVLLVIGWLVAVFSETVLRIFLIFFMKLRDYEGKKVTAGFLKKIYWFGDIREKVSKLAQNQTLKMFFSKAALTIFLVFELKLVLNMTFNLNETYFSEKFAILRYLTSKSSKNCSDWGFWPFSRLNIISFPYFSHNDSWAWCLVVFLQFAGPVNVFLFTVVLWKLLNFLSFWKFLPPVIFYGLILTVHLSPSIPGNLAR